MKGRDDQLPATYLLPIIINYYSYTKYLQLSLIYKRKFYQSISYIQLYFHTNGMADLPGSRVLIGFQLIKYVLSCFLN